ncbi:putative DNA-directed DNA polymerase protein [Rhizobium phage RHEph03]|uniref:Putative DNA-directed DNA polymerase protein n=2 Tax=Cuernavacavirus RHEph02 TaxID=2733899 RepID=L7TR67_9CAUD|nr:DNA polymerase [Rhizobium phage RHEph02]AGC35595.1 putative DNA-directed DNA polymerase protein, family A [Rhizobium phage RHEph02]AGC35656.1 putative DNA-directed DNA polymerase protein [Rhizobium phage RHEph03]
MGRYMVFDLETETHSPFKRKANPFSPDNWVVMRGWKLQGDKRGYATYHPKHDRTSYLHIPDDVVLLVGFNIKFDLLWELAQGNSSLRAFLKRGGMIWDCQYVEYLLRGHGQEVQMVALDDIIESYGGRRKLDEVKLLWEAGVKTSEISEALLADYLLGTQEEQRNSGDIGNTELIFLKQITLATQLGMTKMIQDRMDGLLCTTEMEFNGLKVDVATASARLKVLTRDLSEQTTVLNEYIRDLPWEFNWNSRIQVSCLLFGGTVKYQVREKYLDENGEWARLKAEEKWPLFDNNPVSPTECVGYTNMYGADAFRRKTALGWQEQDTIKSGPKKGTPKFRSVPVLGELKIKWQDRFYKLDGYTIPQDSWKGAETDGERSAEYPEGKPIYSTSGDVIEELVARTNIPFLKAYDRKNELNKEIGTYYVSVNDKGEAKGMLTCVQPWDHVLHHKLNHTSTVTTRLSANDPNMQNIPRVDADKKTGVAKSEVKKMFVSRFGANGRMIEIDYSQLEVVVQGVLSGDPNLCKDLIDRVDFHCMRVAAKFKISYEDAVKWCKPKEGAPPFHPSGVDEGISGPVERTKCKIFSFQRAYGAGAAKIALTTGMPVDEVEQLIENEDLLYPGIVAFNDNVSKQVNATAEPFNAFCEVQQRYRVFRKGYWTAPTGTRYAFRTFDAPDYVKRRGQDQTFSPTQLKNYPVQGTGGEFVQAILGRLFRYFSANDNWNGKAFLVNTVHDCVWFDIHVDHIHEIVPQVIKIMESIPEYYNKRYNMNITVPFPVEAEIGLNMMDLHHYNDNEEFALAA